MLELAYWYAVGAVILIVSYLEVSRFKNRKLRNKGVLILTCFNFIYVMGGVVVMFFDWIGGA